MKKKRGPEFFDQFYGEIYQERWPDLQEALVEKDCKVARWNSWCNLNSEEFFTDEEKVVYHDCFKLSVRGDIPVDDRGVKAWYEMDLASAIAARMLKVEPGDECLDMCAAPGGKSLILFQDMDGKGRLVANEISDTRRQRLKSVIRSYIPRESRDTIFLTGQDAQKIGLKHPGEFSKILVDAPCSGEQHLLENKKELAQWTESRTKNLAGRQYGILCSALLAAKPGAKILYSTCSLSPLENDEVVRKLLKKKADMVALDSGSELPDFSMVEETEFGTQILPDRSGGYGPIYWCQLLRL